jgi:hypothetical protein
VENGISSSLLAAIPTLLGSVVTMLGTCVPKEFRSVPRLIPKLLIETKVDIVEA